MKKIFTLAILCLCAVFAFGQALHVGPTGNVMVNGNAGLTKLHVKGQVTVEPDVGSAAGLRGKDVNARFQLSNSTSNLASSSYLAMNGAASNANFVYSGQFHNWKVNKTAGVDFGVDAMRLWATGRLKIGNPTTAPAWTLEVDGTAGKTGGGEFATVSDKRLKSNVKEFELGLEEVMKINPVTFRYNGQAGISNSSKVYTGVIAQEYAKVEPSAVVEKTFDVYDEVSTADENGSETVKRTLKSSENFLTVDASNIKYMLVNAIKKQQHLIETLQEDNAEMKRQIASLTEAIKGNNNEVINETFDGAAFIDQNNPNPFKGETQIAYFIPDGAKTARVEISGLNGQIVKTIQINNSGKGKISLSAHSVPSGQYIYSLIVDGDMIGSKKMVISN